jgi:hypothetical protein
MEIRECQRRQTCYADRMRDLSVAILVLALNAFGLLLVFEVIRPFRDLSKDGPLAMICWGAGVVVSLIALFKGSRSRVLSWAGLIANALALFAMSALLWLVGHSNFAWH